MRSRVKYGKNLIWIVLLSLSLSACGDNAESPKESLFQANSNKTAMLSEAETDYEVPKTYSSILVDLRGYESKGNKEAVLFSENLPARFEIVNEKTGEVVYTGTAKRKEYESEDGKSVATANFSSFNTPGTYHIKTELLGKSNSFSIVEDSYQSEMKRAYALLHDKRCINCHKLRVPMESDTSKYVDVAGGWHTNADGEKDVVEAARSVMDICTLAEYYKELFSEDLIEETKYELEWLLKMQNAETGGVYTSVSLQNIAGSEEKQMVVGGETTRATAYFCACMAKASVTFKKIDPDFSVKLFQAAGLAWNCLEANKGIVEKGQMYRASVEMYRATGQSVYNNVVLDYLKENAGLPYEDRGSLDSAITYLASERATNVDYCTKLMAEYMDRTEEKVRAAEAAPFFVEPDCSFDELLRNTYELIVVDYIISSNAYVPLEEDYFHYLRGRNEYSIDFTEEINTPNQIIQYMFLAGKLYLER